MKEWEKAFVETPLRWPPDIADPRLYPPGEWSTWESEGLPFAAARFIEGPRAATEILFTPDGVLWRHWHEAGVKITEDWRRETRIPVWRSNHGYWSKQHFTSLARAYARNMEAPQKFDGPQLASLARDLMKGYLNSIRYEPQDSGPMDMVVPRHIRTLLMERV
jgi:hypothetical protein